jgi:hypothetical protein
MRVASPAALLVAKLYKLGERRVEPRADRLEDKDAFDVYRLLQLPTAELARGMNTILGDERSTHVGETAIGFLRELFAAPDALGSGMAGRYVEGVANPETVRLSASALANDLLAQLRRE